MQFKDYQKQSIKTDLFTKPTEINLLSVGFLEKILGIAGESGELTDKIKKILRDKNGEVSIEDKDDITKELGDILWYVSAVSYYLDIPLEHVAQANIDKLSNRKERGVLKGEGDNR